MRVKFIIKYFVKITFLNFLKYRFFLVVNFHQPLLVSLRHHVAEICEPENK